ncbi:endonuclease/exonuclease/phosphatase family protein [Mucilaginibacter corticis]|uniref:Endonuclease/exonuclease/phosphatase family protein n=1 Tax=Mucilaginibacter corticis TaxID=2597670 RepID=A0A556MFR3_9SPHI|nr:endonuclease/exonuclease/phosphatase family protein [Mucilaginibacter corticis]TSJ38781.1 endonuclease/exonuclease/phosphatase family protein [Mucilaginibacter corticis]
MKKIIYIAIACFILSAKSYGQQFNIATYNLRYDNQEDSVKGNGWRLRYPVIAKIVKFNDLDIFGTQEGLFHMLNNLADSLPGYKWIGIGRDDGKEAGEHSAIFYKTSRFKILKQGNFWLSTITDRPNKGWDAVLPRICTWAQFEEIKTGFKFYFFNLHMDHIGVVARKQSATLVLKKIKEMAGNSATIFTGDFNVDQYNESYKEVLSTGVLQDCYHLAPVKLATNGSFNAFDINTKTDSRIDHIFVTKDFNVKRYAILTNSFNGRLPSDHYPVVAIMEH